MNIIIGIMLLSVLLAVNVVYYRVSIRNNLRRYLAMWAISSVILAGIFLGLFRASPAAFGYAVLGYSIFMIIMWFS